MEFANETMCERYIADPFEWREAIVGADRGPGKMVFGMFVPDSVPPRPITDREFGNSMFRIAAAAKAKRRAANKRARSARLANRSK